MKRILTAFLLLFLFPLEVFAYCSSESATIIYVNGIFTDRQKADNDTVLLTKEFESRSSLKKIKVINGYNPSHLAGLGDAVQVMSQALGSSISSFDLETI